MKNLSVCLSIAALLITSANLAMAQEPAYAAHSMRTPANSEPSNIQPQKPTSIWDDTEAVGEHFDLTIFEDDNFEAQVKVGIEL